MQQVARIGASAGTQERGCDATLFARTVLHGFENQSRQARMQRIARHAARAISRCAQALEQIFGARYSGFGWGIEPSQGSWIADSHGPQAEAQFGELAAHDFRSVV